jgi:hypothetical protein
MPATYRSGRPKAARQTFVAATVTPLVGSAAEGLPGHAAYWSTSGAASSNGSHTAATQKCRRRTTAGVDGACDKTRNATGTAKNTGNRKPAHAHVGKNARGDGEKEGSKGQYREPRQRSVRQAGPQRSEHWTHACPVQRTRQGRCHRQRCCQCIAALTGQAQVARVAFQFAPHALWCCCGSRVMRGTRPKNTPPPADASLATRQSCINLSLDGIAHGN